MGQHVPRYGIRVRRKLALLALTGATCLGGIAITAPPASATPVAILPASKPVIRNDGLAPIAVTALAELQTYLATGDAGDLAAYTETRDAIAAAIAGRLGIEASRMIAAWQEADLTHQTALMAAFTQLGVPYRSMASKPGVGFDCSGLTTHAWGVAGVTLTRQSGAQIKAASPRTIDTAMAGDLMYYPGHVMMYLGVDRTMVHSPYTGRTVEVASLSTRKAPKFGNPIG